MNPTSVGSGAGKTMSERDRELLHPQMMLVGVHSSLKYLCRNGEFNHRVFAQDNENHSDHV